MKRDSGHGLRAEARLGTALACLGTLLLVVCAFHAFVLPQTPGRMARPSAALIPELAVWRWLTSAWPDAIADPATVGLSVIVSSLVGFAVYGAAMIVSWKRRCTAGGLTAVVAGALACYLVSVVALPTASTDIYNYILNGRIGAVHGSNPYYTPASEFPDDPIYPYVSPRQRRVPADAKLPAWTLISTGLAAVGGDRPVTNLLVYRGALLAFNLLNLVLIGLLLRRLCPQHLLVGLIAYAWNPIVAALGQSKTDTVMVFFLLLAVWLIANARPYLGAMSLAFSAAVKMLTAPLAVVYVIGELRRGRWREVAMIAALMALPVLAVFAAFWDGPAIIMHHLRWSGSGGAAAPGMLRPALKWAFIALVVVVGLAQDGSYQRLLRGWAVVMIYFCLFLAKFAFAWYLMTLIAVVSLAPDWRFMLVTTLLSFSGFTFDAWYRTSTADFRLTTALPAPRLLIYVALPCAAAAAICVWTLWQNRSTWRTSARATPSGETHYGHPPRKLPQAGVNR